MRRLTATIVTALFMTATMAGVSLAQLTGGTAYPINGTNSPPTSFGTIAQAVTYLGTGGVNGTGQIVLELSTGYAGETAPVTIPAIAGLSATLGVTFRPASGYTALTSVAGTASPNQFAILLKGNYITLDGRAGGAGSSRDWTIRCTGSGASGLGQSAVRLDNATNAMTDITVKYCILEAEAANTTSGIFGMTGNTANTVKNLVIANNLVRSIGTTSTTIRGLGIQIATVSNTGNTGLVIRDNVVNNVYQNGIRMTGGFPGAVISGNEIFDTAALTQPSTTEYAAIYYSTTASPGSSIDHNFIHDIQHTNGATSVMGIYLFNGNTTGNVNRVFDNRIALGAGTLVSGVAVYGIRDNAVAGALFHVDYNSVYLAGTQTAGAGNSAAYRKDVNTATSLRNNILYNARTNSGGTGVHWGISINSATNLTLVNNDYLATGTGGVLGTTTGVAAGNKATLALWKAAVSDAGSISQDPNFLNPTTNPPDLHVNPAIATQLESGGVAVSGIDNDFEGDIRQGSIGYPGGGTAPDIGADEFAGTGLDQTPPTISYALLGNSTSTTTRPFPAVTVTDASGVNGAPGTRPRVYYKKTTDTDTFNDNTSGTAGWKYAEANGAASAFDFTIDYSRLFGGTVSGGDVIQYFVVAQDNAGTPNLAINSGTFAAAPTSVALTAAAFPIGGAINSYTVQACFGASRTVGAGGDYATLKAAFDALNASILCSNVTLTVLAGGTTETASAALNQLNYDAGGPYTVTIRPDMATTPTITGSIAGAVIKFNGADNVVIDGSNSGGTSRDLTIANSSTAGATAAIWVASLGTGLGAANISVKNCNMAAGADPSTSANETFGILAGGTSLATGSDGVDNDNLIIDNNGITKARYGIFVRGGAANTVDNVSISGNLVGPATFGSSQIGKAGIVLQQANNGLITRNEVRCVGELASQTVNGATDKIGIGLGDFGWTPTGTALTGCSVTRNYVHDIVEERTFSAIGILVAGNGAPSNSVVANNMIQGVRANGTSGDQGVSLGLGGASSGDRVVFNSILMAGDCDPGASTAATYPNVGLKIAAATVTNLTLKNNAVSVDVTGNTGTNKHYAVIAPATTYAWGTGGADNNDYYVNAGNSQMVLGGTGTGQFPTDVVTLAAWRTQFTPNQDANSITASPPYLLTPDLHLDTASPTPLESAGTPIAGVANDFDDDTRHATAPDIGADEGSFTPLASLDIQALAFIDPTNGGSKTQGLAFQPAANFANNSAGAQVNVPVRFRIVGPAPAVTEIYNDTQTIPSISGSGGSATQLFAGVTIAAGGTYTMYARAEMPGDILPGNDEISGTFEVLAPLCGSYLVGTGQPAPFDRLTTAIARLNQVGVSCAVEFQLTDASYSAGETFPLVINPITGGSVSNTFTLKPGPGATVAISGNSTTSVLKLNGADYVTIDGSNNGTTSRDLSVTNTSLLGSTATIWLASQGAGAGATNNTVRNCIISAGVDQSANTLTTFGILTSGGTVSESSDGADNDANTFANNSIFRVRYGIWIRGFVGNPNDNVTIAGNLVGPAAFGSNQVGKSGIVVQQVDNCLITGNEVRCVGVLAADAASGTDRVGIAVASNAWPPAATAATNVTVTRNYVHDIIEEKTFSAVGIVLAGSGAPSSNVVSNNMVQNVRANGTSGDQGVGIGTDGGDGDRIVFNSVYLSGDIDPGAAVTATQSQCGIRVATTSAANLTLRNNISVADNSSNTVTLKHYAIVAPTTAYAWGTGGADNNDLYPATANAQAVLGGIGTAVPYGDVAALANWRTQFTPNQDANSISAPAPFLLTPDLHINPATPSAIESGGAPVAGITNDFDNDTRHVATPDIGADEGNFTSLSATDVAAQAFIDPTNGGTRGAGVAFTPQARFINNGTAGLTNVPVRYRIVGPAPAVTEIYNDTQTIPALTASGGTAIQSFTALSIAATGTYTIFAQAEQAGDTVPANDQISGTFDVFAPLAGVYPVGAAQAAPFNTLTAAIAKLNQVGVSAAVTFSLTDSLYAAGETFPLTINAIQGGGAVNTFTIKPAPGVVAAVRGATPAALLTLNGADYVTLDGSNTPAGTTRDLTLQNTSAGSATAVVWGQTAGADAAAHNSVAHCNIVGYGSGASLIGVGFGGATIGVTSNGTGNNGNSVLNCAISRAAYGIYSGGASAASPNSGTVIADNVMNAASPAQINKAGVFVRFDDGVQVLRNTVALVSQPSGSAAGIALGLGPVTNVLTATTSDEVRNATVSRNRIISVDAPSATGFSAVGIILGAATSGTNTVDGNVISGVSSPATPSDLTAGIYAVAALGGTTRIYFNSIAMAGARGGAEQPSLALAINGVDAAVDIRNNILYNTQTSSSSGFSYAIGLGYSTYLNLISDYNEFFTGGAQDRFSVVGGLANTPTGDRTGLPAWQAETGQDAHSFVGDPLFANVATDLHLALAGPTLPPAYHVGIAIAGFTTDMDGETRHNPPTIGADEIFDTVAPAVAVTSPNGAENFVDGSIRNITWTATDLFGVTTVDIEYSINSGTTWLPVVAAVANTGTYAWTVPNTPTTQARVRVTARDAATNAGTDLSDADFIITSQSAVGEMGLPAVTSVGVNYPNPFVRSTVIPYGIKADSHVRLDIFDVSGRLVRTLVDQEERAGSRVLNWDGTDGHGGRVASGVYMVRFIADGQVQTRSLRVVR